MVFGEPVYNTEQRRAILAEFKRYIDKLRKKKHLPPWKVVKTKRKKLKRTIKVYKRKKTRKKKQKDAVDALNGRYIK